MLVDDDVCTRQVACHILEDASYEVILDHRMPGIDGLGTLQALVQRDPTVRVLAWSGEHERTLAEQFLSYGVEDFIDRPCTTRDLLERAERILGTSCDTEVYCTHAEHGG